MALAHWIREHTAHDAVLYGGGFGLVGFFADRAWINADGVVNTANYQQVLESGDLVGYLARNRVDFAVQFRDPVESAPGRVAVEVPGALHEIRVVLSLPEDAVIHATRFGERAPDREVVVVRFDPTRARAVRRPW
ncbi:MAG: hypothetical protein R3324_12475 [Halobacteriales archaeon]|nr:hypothetical protein [Halobacteriales archaeon]